MAVSPLLHQSHEVLNADFCSGYIDAFGKWNTGFPCPWTGGQDSSSSSSSSSGSTPGFCCGTETYKYCCSGKLRGPLIPAISGAQPPPAISDGAAVVEDPLLLVLAVTLGVAAGMTLLILIACFVCPGCLLHKKRRPGIASGGGPLYRLPCSSTMSTYVPSSCGGPSTTTAAAATTTGGVAAITTPNGSGGGVGHLSRTYHQHHPASMMSFLHHDVNPRPSASFHSFNGAAALGVGVGGGMAPASLYSSLSESAAAAIGDNNNVHHQQQYSDAYGLRQQRESGDDGNDDEEETANHLHLHRNLFWESRQQQQQQEGISSSSSSNQGHGNHHILRHCQEHRQEEEEEEEEADPSPPPPYQPNETDDYRRHHQRIHHHLLHSSNSNRRMTQQQLSNGNGNISPRQPAICIIDDAMLMHRDVDRHPHHHHLHRHHHHQPQLTFHSTKF